MGIAELNHFLGGPLNGWAGVGWHTEPVFRDYSMEKGPRLSLASVSLVTNLSVV